MNQGTFENSLQNFKNNRLNMNYLLKSCIAEEADFVIIQTGLNRSNTTAMIELVTVDLNFYSIVVDKIAEIHAGSN